MQQKVANWRALSFQAESLEQTAFVQVKSARAVWDPEISRFRCPIGTQRGGTVTNRSGTTCGLGVARRAINAIVGGAERAGAALDRRANHRSARRRGRAGGAARAGARVANRAAEIVDPSKVRTRPRKQQTARVNRRANRAQALARAAERAAEVVDPSKVKKPKKRRERVGGNRAAAGARAADRLANFVDPSKAPDKRRNNNRRADVLEAAARRADRAAEVVDPSKSKKKKPAKRVVAEAEAPKKVPAAKKVPAKKKAPAKRVIADADKPKAPVKKAPAKRAAAKKAPAKPAARRQAARGVAAERVNRAAPAENIVDGGAPEPSRRVVNARPSRGLRLNTAERNEEREVFDNVVRSMNDSELRGHRDDLEEAHALLLKEKQRLAAAMAADPDVDLLQQLEQAELALDRNNVQRVLMADEMFDRKRARGIRPSSRVVIASEKAPTPKPKTPKPKAPSKPKTDRDAAVLANEKDPRFGLSPEQMNQARDKFAADHAKLDDAGLAARATKLRGERPARSADAKARGEEWKADQADDTKFKKYMLAHRAYQRNLLETLEVQKERNRRDEARRQAKKHRRTSHNGPGKGNWQKGLVPEAEVAVDPKLKDYDAGVKHLREGGDLAAVPDEAILEAILDADMKNANGVVFKFSDILKKDNGFSQGARLHNDRFSMKKIKESGGHYQIWEVWEVKDKQTGESWFMKASQYGNHDALLERLGEDVGRLVGFDADERNGNIRWGKMDDQAGNRPVRWFLSRHVAHYQKDGPRDPAAYKEFGHGGNGLVDVDPKDVARMAVMDYLVDNQDRHGGNFMVYRGHAGRDRVAPIDNGLLFGGREFDAEYQGLVPPAERFNAFARQRGKMSPAKYGGGEGGNVIFRKSYRPDEPGRQAFLREARRIIDLMENVNADDLFDPARFERRGAKISPTEKAHLEAAKTLFMLRREQIRVNGADQLFAAFGQRGW